MSSDQWAVIVGLFLAAVVLWTLTKRERGR